MCVCQTLETLFMTFESILILLKPKHQILWEELEIKRFRAQLCLGEKDTLALCWNGRETILALQLPAFAECLLGMQHTTNQQRCTSREQNRKLFLI